VGAVDVCAQRSLWEIAHGRSGQPFAVLGSIAGIAYLVALVWLRWRS
jgi:hypothetical protein